jgi:hypothetical protein
MCSSAPAESSSPPADESGVVAAPDPLSGQHRQPLTDDGLPFVGDLGGHRPARPDWTCLDCGQQWPCSPARYLLAAHLQYDRAAAVVVARRLGRCLVHAVYDQPGRSVGSLYDQFLHWLTPVGHPTELPLTTAGRTGPSAGTAMTPIDYTVADRAEPGRRWVADPPEPAAVPPNRPGTRPPTETGNTPEQIWPITNPDTRIP